MPAISSYSSRKSRFLDRMNVLVPWQDIADKLLHVYPSSRRGRRPFPWCLCSVSTACNSGLTSVTERLKTPCMMSCRSVNLRGSVTRCQIVQTIMNFRHFLEKHHAGEQILALINQKLKQAGLMLRQGIIIDATIISAPCSVKIKPVNGILKCIRPAREISGTLV